MHSAVPYPDNFFRLRSFLSSSADICGDFNFRKSRVDIQSSFVRWRHQSHILHKKIKSPLPFTPIHLSFRIYVYLCLFHNLINHSLVRYSILKVYSIFYCISFKEPWWHSILRYILQYEKIQYVLQNICQHAWKCINW